MRDSIAATGFGNENADINLIWFCVDETSSKLYKTIKNLAKATSVWPSVPIIVIITKSYSELECVENIAMVNDAFETMKYSANLKKVIPVVAKVYKINDDILVPNDGIEELIDETNKLLPEGIKAAEYDIAKYKLNKKRVLRKVWL